MIASKTAVTSMPDTYVNHTLTDIDGLCTCLLLKMIVELFVCEFSCVCVCACLYANLRPSNR
jgi:hypothetical protein